jgi:hypothetical protein
MASPVTVEQVETLAEQLPPEEQLRLIASITARLSQLSALPPAGEEKRRNEYATRVEAFLKMSDEQAAECQGEVDSSVDIRRIREERASRL